jgi:hypothetical protein
MKYLSLLPFDPGLIKWLGVCLGSSESTSDRKKVNLDIPFLVMELYLSYWNMLLV